MTVMLTKADIYILPGVDLEGFMSAKEGECSPSPRKEACGMFRHQLWPLLATVHGGQT